MRRRGKQHQNERSSAPEMADARLHAAIEREYRGDDPWQYLPAEAPRPAAHPQPLGESASMAGSHRSPRAALHSLLELAGILRGEKRRVPARVRLATTVLLVTALSTGAVLAASTIFNLGKPTNNVSTNQYFPLSGFRYVKGLQPSGKPRVLFIGTLTGWMSPAAVERWPLVKALQQFGAFTHLKALDQVCNQNPQAQQSLCSAPTFDWAHATYRSPYVRFEERELVREAHVKPKPPYYSIPLKPYQRMNRAQLAIYKRFVHIHPPLPVPGDRYNASYAEAVGQLPLVIVGNYLEQGPSQVLHAADIEQQLAPPGPTPTPNASGVTNVQYYYSGLTFAQVQHALQTQTDPKNSTLVEDVNAEANIITALICRADGGKPKSVCGRPVIASLLRHIR